MKHTLMVASLVALTACTTTPVTKPAAPAPVVQAPAEPVMELVEGEVLSSDTTQAVATDFGLIFIDRDMTFSGVLPCKGCSGIQYQLNIMQDGKFSARREFLDKNQIELIEGTWQLDARTLHLVSKSDVPSFLFSSNHHLTVLDAAGKPIVTKENQTLTREMQFKRIDTRMPMLGVYQLTGTNATFTDCKTQQQLPVAMTQHHLPMMRSYQTDPQLQGKGIIATLSGRKDGEQQQALFIDRFEQFWPGAQCPEPQQVNQIQGVVWRVATVSHIGVPQKLNMRVLFSPDQRLYGFAGCNNFNATYQRKDNQLSVTPLVSTRKQCAEGNFYEKQFTQQLQLADRIELQHNKLRIYHKNQVVIEMTPALN